MIFVIGRTSKLNINSTKIVVLVYDKKVSRNFSRISIVTGLLPGWDSETKGAILRIARTNATLKRPVNKLFPLEYTYHDTNQTDKAREQRLRCEAAIIGEVKRKSECWLCKNWEGGGVFEHCK